MLKVLL